MTDHDRMNDDGAPAPSDTQPAPSTPAPSDTQPGNIAPKYPCWSLYAVGSPLLTHGIPMVPDNTPVVVISTVVANWGEHGLKARYLLRVEGKMTSPLFGEELYCFEENLKPYDINPEYGPHEHASAMAGDPFPEAMSSLALAEAIEQVQIDMAGGVAAPIPEYTTSDFETMLRKNWKKEPPQ